MATYHSFPSESSSKIDSGPVIPDLVAGPAPSWCAIRFSATLYMQRSSRPHVLPSMFDKPTPSKSKSEISPPQALRDRLSHRRLEKFGYRRAERHIAANKGCMVHDTIPELSG
jgi:hypothetical protein